MMGWWAAVGGRRGVGIVVRRAAGGDTARGRDSGVAVPSPSLCLSRLGSRHLAQHLPTMSLVSRKFIDFATVALSVLFNNYYSIID